MSSHNESPLGGVLLIFIGIPALGALVIAAGYFAFRLLKWTAYWIHELVGYSLGEILFVYLVCGLIGMIIMVGIE